MNAVLIGLGNIGLNYDLNSPERIQTHAKALAVQGIDVIGVDADAAQRHCAQQVYGFHCVASLSDVPDDCHPDLVIVASPTALHYEHTLWGLERQPGAMLLEKPLADNEAQLQQLITCVQAASITVMVNLIRNYDAPTLLLLKHLPRPVDITVEYATSLVHNGIHFLALLQKVYGSVLTHEVLQYHAICPVVRFQFQQCRALFKPEVSGLDNRLFIHTSDTDIQFSQGGREVCIQRTGRADLRLTARLSNYQEVVMASVLQVMDGQQEDDSFSIACDAQSRIHSILAEAET